MDCLALAEKLTAKTRVNHATISPISVKNVVKPIVAQSENVDENFSPFTSSAINTPPYIPEISEVFDDNNLNRYFRRFLSQRKHVAVLDFIELAYQYKKNYPKTPEKQVKAHRNVVEHLGKLPSQFIKDATFGSETMSAISSNSFDKCVDSLLCSLNVKDFKSFVSSDLFSKWILKYHNVK